MNLKTGSASGKWQKGETGNRFGRPRTAVLAEYIKQNTEDCKEIVDEMLQIIRNQEEDASERISAAKFLTERCLGKVPDQVQHSGTVGFELFLNAVRQRLGTEEPQKQLAESSDE